MPELGDDGQGLVFGLILVDGHGGRCIIPLQSWTSRALSRSFFALASLSLSSCLHFLLGFWSTQSAFFLFFLSFVVIPFFSILLVRISHSFNFPVWFGFGKVKAFSSPQPNMLFTTLFATAFLAMKVGKLSRLKLSLECTQFYLGS